MKFNQCIVGTPQPIIWEAVCWTGCYDGGWQREIVPEAFAHPAKISRALIRRIYEHAFIEGWLRAGDVVVDPFGGIAGTALDAMWNGCHWVGCELELRFVGLAQQNIDLWKRKYGSKPGFGSARILQGDSRKLVEVIASADLVCSSPPFHDSMSNKPSAQILAGSGGRMGESCKSDDVYGQSPGQLGSMKEGESPTVDLVCSSPPYAAIATGAGGLNTKPGKDGQQSGRNPNSASQDTDQHYGETAGQLATMREEEAPACIVSSPPFSRQQSGGGLALRDAIYDGDGHRFGANHGYQNQAGTDGNIASMPEGRFDAVVSSPPYEQERFNERNGLKKWPLIRGRKGLPYGQENGQIGAGRDDPDTFWQAARKIVAQYHAILKPGGHAIWVTKDFVRKGRRVPFSDQWQALCEAEGFRLVCRHRAMLVAYHGEQGALFGAIEQLTTARKSFFRRLAEAKGSPVIDWEDVICLQKEVSV